MVAFSPESTVLSFCPSDVIKVNAPGLATTTNSKASSSSTSRSTFLAVSTSPDQDQKSDPALQRTAAHLERLNKRKILKTNNDDGGGSDDMDAILQEYLLQPANVLKQELKVRHLPTRGRKPDLARRLAEYDLKVQRGIDIEAEEAEEIIEAWNPEESSSSSSKTKSSSSSSSSSSDSSSGDNAQQQQQQTQKRLNTFCGLHLSPAAGRALGKADFGTPSPIQKAAIPALLNRESLILHAETGSGKTLAYLLPLTEQLWLEHEEDIDGGYGFILTPTRELAAQVAGVAMVLAPPGSVRMVSRATNLMNDGLREEGEEPEGGILDKGDGRTSPRLFIGSAKSILHSLYGDGKMPASPTRKPKAMHLLKHTRWVVLDEVDRLLAGKKSSSRHEKPAAVITSAVTRRTLGNAQVIAASATVGRSLKRELSRVLGLEPKDCPRVVRGAGEDKNNSNLHHEDTTGRHVGRAVKIPQTVQHYVTAIDTSSVGKLLTNAFYVLRALSQNGKHNKILFVLTKTCDINTQNAIGALKHFGCQPEPRSLLDALEAQGTNQMIELHRQVSGATGVGESLASSSSSYFSGKDDDDDDNNGSDDNADSDGSDGYLLVTGEDTVRGLHLDGLDVVVVVGRANGPDEYTHIAGRTGRAGRPGKVINVLSNKDSAALSGWEKMLDVEFHPIDTDGITRLE